jgi:hypothetical protein
VTLRLNQVPGTGHGGMARWGITDDAGAPLGEVYASNRASWEATDGPVTYETRYVVTIGEMQLTGPTLARTMRALAAVLEHSAGYVIDPTVPEESDTLCLRVIPEGHQSTIRLDEAATTPIDGIAVVAVGRTPRR